MEINTYNSTISSGETNTLNHILKQRFENPMQSFTKSLLAKTPEFLSSYIIEDYIKNKVQSNILPITGDWWICTRDGNFYAICICECIRDIEKAFARELENCKYPVIFVVENFFTKEISLVFKNKTYTLEEFAATFNSTPVKRDDSGNQTQGEDENNEKKLETSAMKWCQKKLNPNTMIFHSVVEELFLDKYFDYKINFDVVWANFFHGKPKFFIGEVKHKTMNDDNVYQINRFENNIYNHIALCSNINVVAIAIVSKKGERENTTNKIISNEDVPLFYKIMDKSFFSIGKSGIGATSEATRKWGGGRQKTIRYPFSSFSRIMDFSVIDVGYDVNSKHFIKLFNDVLTKNARILFKDQCAITFYKKHIAKFYALFRLIVDGFDVDYNDFFTNQDMFNNILTINGKKVCFKFVDSVRSWNIKFLESALEKLKLEKVDYILLYQDKTKDRNGKEDVFSLKKETCKVEESGQDFSYYLIDEDSGVNTIEIIGCISLDDFVALSHQLPAGIEQNQHNLSKAKGYYYKDGSNREWITKGNAPKENEICHFYQFEGGGKDTSPKFLPYKKNNAFPFLVSYIMYH